jgi:hypothetical protein
MDERENSGPAPYVIAVTGHRDLRPGDVPQLRAAVREVLTDLRGRTQQRLLLLSGLAEGADQLAAEVALDEGVLLAAAIPMPLDIFREQMEPAGQRELERLMGLSAVEIFLPIAGPAGQAGRTEEAVRTSEEARAECYETLARYLVRQGRALLALWDGQPSEKLGGTCRVVQYARFGRADAAAERVESNCEAVYQIVTPRVSGTGAAPEIQTIVLPCEPGPAQPKPGPAQHNEELQPVVRARPGLGLEGLFE